jgi:hypothetical protein
MTGVGANASLEVAGDHGLGLRGDFPQLVTSGSLMATRENSRSSGEAMPLRTSLR